MAAALEPILEPKRVKELNNKFVHELKLIARHKQTTQFGHHGGKVKGLAWYNDEFWFACDVGKKIWMPFGLKLEKSSQSMIVQINQNLHGSYKRCNGLFARATGTGKIYVLHSGRVGGGQGVTLKGFLALYKGDRKKVRAPRGNSVFEEWLYVTTLGSKKMRSEVLRFVREVDRVKKKLKGNVGRARPNRKS